MISMTELKTKPTNKSVDQFLKKVENPIKRDINIQSLRELILESVNRLKEEDI